MLPQLALLSLVALPALAASSSASSSASVSTTSIFFAALYDYDSGDDSTDSTATTEAPPTLVASVVDSNPTATVLAIECSDAQCPPSQPPVTITANPTLFVFQSTLPASEYGGEDFSGTVTISTQCDLKGTTAGVCTVLNAGPAALFATDTEDLSDPNSSTEGRETVTLEKSDIVFSPVTITAGLDKLAKASASPSPTTGGSAANGAVTSTQSGSGGAASQTGNAASGIGASSGVAISLAAIMGYFFL
ncbi:MAG: hypothetical protein M1820_006616 [Bogoriella megaspora]|nr:MAG: hypothetical protein M1820_006616 [Bogoriella megaspora]